MKKVLLSFMLAVSALLISGVAFGQGSTTSGMSGSIKDATGQPLPGATVIAVHTPTGSQFGAVTNLDGRFRIANMQVGGPYTLTVTFVGYQEFKQEGLYTNLGQTLPVKTIVLQEESAQLEEVVVVAQRDVVFDANRTGAQTVVSKELVSTLPNVTRDLSDFIRATPQATGTFGGGLSIAGTNNRYNSIFIDGAVNNDVFGLASNGQNGGQIGVSPISIDAIEQFQVVVSPFDVTQGGFAGGGINAVTRSGSNKFEGSVYYLVRNQSLAGKTPTNVSTDDRQKLDDFSAKTYGFRLGGPLIKDKLFFFVNTEIQQDETPQPFSFTDYTGDYTREQLTSLVNKLNGYGYDPGGYEGVIDELQGQKFLIKLDYNLNKTHKLTLRHSYTKGESTDRNTSNTRNIRFANSGIYFPSITNSTAIELKSNFTNSSNNLIIGYTTVEDNRDPIGNPFPYVQIDDGAIELGSEQFSTGNLLEQKIFTITNNFNLYKGKHTFTFGTHNEFYDMNNVFIRQNFGYYEFNTLEEFLTDQPAREYARSYSLIDNTTGDATAAAAKFKAMQLGFYAQDEIQFSDKFKLTAGIRIDIPMFNDDPANDGFFNTQAVSEIESYGYDLKGARGGSAPKSQVMFSPRVGFNYDISGDQTTQLRGGIGIFTSRVPFVWPGAMYNNNGATVGGFVTSGTETNPILFRPDINNQYTYGDFGGTDQIPQGQMDLFAEDFKFPQIMRASLAVDQKLPWGLVGTLELLYSKTLNNIFYENVNIKPSTSSYSGPDGRPLFNRFDPIISEYSGIYLASNTNKGYTFNFTAQVQKPFENGFTASLAYNYGTAFNVFEGTSSQNSSQWRGTYSVMGRNVTPLGRSDFDAGHRIVGMASYRKEWGKVSASTVSIFLNSQSGSPFSYVYDDDFTNEDSRDRALIFVPANQQQIVFQEYTSGDRTITAQEQWDAFNSYIENDEHLKDRRGTYAERNGIRTPWETILDLKFIQDFYVEAGGMKHNLQFGFDIFNFTNLLNKDWGQRWFASEDSGSQAVLLDNRGDNDGDGIPEFRFDTSIKDKKDLLIPDDTGISSSRWQMQLSVRYSF